MASLRASRVLVSLPDRLVVVTAAESGVSLEQVFRRLVVSRRGEAVQETAAALARVGRWTRAFQDGVPVRNPAARRDQREYLDVRLRRLVAALNGRFTEAHRRALLERFEAYASRVDGDDRRAVAVHADLCPANILVRPDAVTVLDFGMSADDVRFTDLAHLDSHLQRLGRRWRLPPRIVETLERALLTAYDPSFDTSHPLFRLLLLQHLVCQMTECAEAAAGPWPFLHARLVQHRVSTAMSLAVAL